jgi:branched-chain amino acid transport system permease protein
MPELFRFINDYKLLVYGGLLLLVMRFSPEGLAGLFQRFARVRLP